MVGRPALRPVPAPLYDPSREHDACGVGFVAARRGAASAELVARALEALAGLAHRGGVAADAATGDGAGISIPLPATFLRSIAREGGVAAPVERLALGMAFVPTAPDAAARAETELASALEAYGLAVAGWRSVPVHTELLAGRATDDAPRVRQLFVVRPRRMRAVTFRRRLLLARRRFELAAPEGTSLASLSPDTVVYKGLFIGSELGEYYADLRRPDLAVRYALFHQRYSTNTFPSWRLAQPFRYLAHNGEINTVRGNREQMRGRRSALGGGRWARELGRTGAILTPGASDSLSLDEVLELMVLGGWRIEEAMRALIPGAPNLDGGTPGTSPIEPWDGPAALVFADGVTVGARLDRNGLRPAAFAIDATGLVICASEAGCVEMAADAIVRRGRLGPGESIVLDTRSGVLQEAAEPGRTTDVRDRRPMLATSGRAGADPGPAPVDPAARVALGLDAELLRQVIRPMAGAAREPLWSMGDDTPVAPLASRPRRPTDFLRQSFAQVTNPAIDPERERVVMDLSTDLGRQPLLLDRGSPPDASVMLEGPILGRADLAAIRAQLAAARCVSIDCTWPVRSGAAGLESALGRAARRAVGAARRGVELLVLDDRGIGRRRAAIPAVLAAGRVHQALVEAGLRPRTDLLVVSGDAFDVHDVAMTLAVGARAVHPWLLFELAAEQAGQRGSEELTRDAAVANVRSALERGLRKVMARMGISALRSYVGGQCFEAVGLDARTAALCFPAAGLHPGEVGLATIGEAILARHARAYADGGAHLVDPGLIRYRSAGELHVFAPPVVRALQAAAGAPDAPAGAAAFAASRAAAARTQPVTPRDLLQIRPAESPLPLAAVEPASLIVRRFVSSAMSLGALSPEAHQALAIGMSRLGGASNTGEGGEDPAWYVPLPNGDRRESAIKQVASARFGVTTPYLARAEQLEIKMAQGSKPGEGGQLPGRKATAFIAALRRGLPGRTMISPPPHHDIYSIEDLAQLIADLRAVNPMARIGVKLVAGTGVGTIAAGVAKARADYILISGHAGGTGASPLSSIKHVGLPWELGLAETQQVLVRDHLRDRVALRVDGGLQAGRDVVIAALLGAEEYGFGTSALIALGCDMARQCHLDTCPTGIATQRPDLRAKFAGTPEAVVTFFTGLAEDVRAELAALGLSSLGAAIGRTDLLTAIPDDRLEMRGVASGPTWSVPPDRPGPPRVHGRLAAAPVASALEEQLLPRILTDLRGGRPHTSSHRIRTRERSFGAAIAGELSREPTPVGGRPHVALRLTGSAGQSFGAFVTSGMRLLLEGQANDYVAKGLSGGTVVVRPPDEATFVAAEQTIAGNTCLYGATGGRLHLVGRAGMRFAVRNSGASAVVEGIGAHGCEYMTAGTVVVLGPVGPNFAAGMTGGRAYVLDGAGVVPRAPHEPPLSAVPLVAEDLAAAPELEAEVRELVAAHAAEGSVLAARLLEDWASACRRFLVVEPAAPPPVRAGEAVIAGATMASAV